MAVPAVRGKMFSMPERPACPFRAVQRLAPNLVVGRARGMSAAARYAGVKLRDRVPQALATLRREPVLMPGEPGWRRDAPP